MKLLPIALHFLNSIKLFHVQVWIFLRLPNVMSLLSLRENSYYCNMNTEFHEIILVIHNLNVYIIESLILLLILF